MGNVDETKRFCNTFWSHPYFLKEKDPLIRLSFLPSKSLLSSSKLRPSELEKRKSNFDDDSVQRLRAFSEKGYDVYYFVNAIKPGVKFAKNTDVIRRLYLPLDLDFRLPYDPLEIFQEFGLTPSLIIQSSEREGLRKHQILLGIKDADTLTTEEQVSLSREFCSVFGSDAVHDAKRILRLPGTLNHKGREDKKAVSSVKLLWAGEEECWTAQEIKEQIQAFHSSSLSRELVSLGFKDIRKGGLVQGEKGEYGSWLTALTQAQAGKWSIGEGGRHNALCSWGVQMAASRMPWPNISENLGILRVGAFETPYADDMDYARVLSGVRQKWEEIDKELDELIASARADDADQEQEKVPVLLNGTNGSHKNVEHIEIVSVTGGEKSTENITKEPAIEARISSLSARRAPSTENHHIHSFVRSLSEQMDGETKEEWLDFLARALAATLYFSHKDVGRIGRLSRLVFERLRRAGCAVGEFFSVPKFSDDILPHWNMSPLGDKSAQVFLSDVLGEISDRIIEQRKELESHRAVIAANAALGASSDKKKKPKYTFGVQGVFEQAYLKNMLGRMAAEPYRDKTKEIIAFQNGYLDLRAWENENQSLEKSWHPIKQAWRYFPSACAAHFRYEEAVAFNQEQQESGPWGKITGGNLCLPKLAEFLDTPFPGEIDTWRAVLRVIGYCLLNTNPYQKYFYLEGLAGSGKGTLAEIITTIMGSKNTGHLAFDRILSDAWLGPLEHKNVVIIDEAESCHAKTHQKVMSELARVTGGETASARKLHCDSRDIQCSQKFIIITNRGIETDDAVGQQARRIVPLNFAHKPQGKIIPRLFASIVGAEGNNIATRSALELAQSWHAGADLFTAGLDSASMSRGRERFEENTQALKQFLTAIIVRDWRYNTSSLLLWKLAEIYYESRGLGTRFLDRRVGAEMDALGYEKSKYTAAPIWNDSQKEKIDSRGMGYLEVCINPKALVSALDMTPAEIVRHIKSKSEKLEKLWYLAIGALRIDDIHSVGSSPFLMSHFSEASSGIMWG